MIITNIQGLSCAFEGQEPVTERVNLNMLGNMGIISKEDLGLEYWFPPLVPYPLNGEVGMGVVRVTLKLSTRKGGYVGNMQW